jgi:tetratricopeptide (TPR) repeat protein
MKLNKHFNRKNLLWFGLIKKAVFLLFIVFTSFAKANDNNSKFDSANAAYAKGNYENAILLYEKIVSEGQEAPELYFNLGNAYFKSKKIALAILNYERAKKLNPDNEDILVNLKLANQQIEDKIDAVPQLFLLEWKNGFIHTFTEKGWAILCIVFVTIGLILIAIYISSNNQLIKRIGFFGGVSILLFSTFLFFAAKNKYNLTKYSSDAIITSSSVTATGSPSEKGTKLFILHEGTKVNITQEDADWAEIKIANGTVGWVKSNSLTSI